MPKIDASDRVFAELRRLLQAEGMAPGARLPTERALSGRLGVNRASLHKALARLEMEGAVIRQVGRGTFASAPTRAPEPVAGSASPIELMEARLTLEPAIIGEAALRARKPDLQRLELCLVRSEARDDFRGFERWDIAFHHALAAATQNPILVLVMEVMRTMRSTPEWDRLKRDSFTPQLRDRYRDEHRAILRTLEARNPAGAARAMTRHMQTVRAAVSGDPWPPRAAPVDP